MRKFLFFFLGLSISYCLFWLPYANATQLIFNTKGGIIGSYPDSSHTILNDALGIKQRASGSVTVPGSGTAPSVKVPFTAVTNISKGSIAKAAAGCSSVVGAVFCAATAAQLIDETLNHPTGPGRYRQCPSGVSAFVCLAPAPKPGDPPFSDTQTGWHTSVGGRPCYLPGDSCSIGQAAQSIAVTGCGTGGKLGTYGAPTTSSGKTNIALTCYTSDNRGPFGAGQISLLVPTQPYSPSPVAATPTDIALTLQQRMDADFAANRRLYDAMKTDQANNPNNANAPNPVSPDTSVDVTASPITSPERVVSEVKSTKTDGSIDTTTKTEKTVVTPTTTGTTVGNSKTEFPSQTVTNSTTVNNVTNTTTTETTTVNHPAPTTTTPTAPTDFPDDYNREVTQQKISDELAGTGAPNLPDLTESTKAKSDEQKTELDTLISELPSKFDQDKQSWFSWVWTPPIGQCAPSSGSVHGVAVTLDICPTVNMIRDALGWLFALFSAWSIYGLIFKGE